MLGAVGWIEALIPLLLLSCIVVTSYVMWGKGTLHYRRIAGGCYLVLVVGLIFSFFIALDAENEYAAFALLLSTTVVAALGFVWPWLSTQLLRVRKKHAAEP